MTTAQLDFEVGPDLEAVAPAEARGLERDQVRLLVARRGNGEIVHSTFRHLPDFLDAGDLVVINTSATLPAALEATAPYGTAFTVHLSTRLSGTLWVVEPRRLRGGATERWSGGPPPSRIRVGDGGSIELVERYLTSDRLWVARLSVPGDPLVWLGENGRPIRYGYVERDWPIDAYQNAYSDQPGSAEMPSAGRPLTARVIARLVAKGVGVTPIVLHAGVSSLESKEVPFPEYVLVDTPTADRVNATRRAGRRVIAVGTTVVRALESAAGPEGQVQPMDGWTDLVITPERGVWVVDGIVTGWHEPEASHLLMLEAIAGHDLLRRSYAAGLAEGYLWHEFGDSHLILP